MQQCKHCHHILERCPRCGGWLDFIPHRRHTPGVRRYCLWCGDLFTPPPRLTPYRSARENFCCKEHRQQFRRLVQRRKALAEGCCRVCGKPLTPEDRVRISTSGLCLDCSALFQVLRERKNYAKKLLASRQAGLRTLPTPVLRRRLVAALWGRAQLDRVRREVKAKRRQGFIWQRTFRVIGRMNRRKAPLM